MPIKNYQNTSTFSCHNSVMDCHYNGDPSCGLLTTSSSSISSTLSSYSITTAPTKKQPSPPPCKHKYKGVVPQPNGRWGAQLYKGNKRIWIGTYDTQNQAAHAYDMAVIRFRGGQAITNFPIRHCGRVQLDFLASHSEARVIDMLRNHTYQDELARYMRARLARNRAKKTGLDCCSNRELLFKKVMTPSDVGRLHRLVIPKHYAESYLPNIVHEKMEGESIILNFEDGNKDRMWRFKYCYWKSSQNYVLTKGWGEFVKDKGLKAGDTVLFYCNVEGSDARFSIDTSCSKEDNVKYTINDGSINNNDDDQVALSRSNVSIRLFGVDVFPTVNPILSISAASYGIHAYGGRNSQLDGGEVVQTQGFEKIF